MAAAGAGGGRGASTGAPPHAGKEHGQGTAPRRWWRGRASSAALRPGGPLEALEDHELVALVLAGGEEAARVLVERHSATGWRIALGITGNRAVAEEVVQDAFARAFTHLRGYDRRRPFRPWFCRIVSNCALNAVRKEPRDLPLLESVPARAQDASEAGLLQRIAPLPAPQRAVLVLHYGVGLTAPEIAQVLGLPVGTVHSRLGRARAALRGREDP